MSKGATTPEGRARISAAQKRRWAQWREAKALGIPLPHKRIGRPPKPPATPPRTEWVESPEQAQARRIAYLKEKYPTRNWGDLKSLD
jgi:hypothetical protein